MILIYFDIYLIYILYSSQQGLVYDKFIPLHHQDQAAARPSPLDPGQGEVQVGRLEPEVPVLICEDEGAQKACLSCPLVYLKLVVGIPILQLISLLTMLDE